LFFFQAEDGIRDKLVTGVQTCALPISRSVYSLSCPVFLCVGTPAPGTQPSDDVADISKKSYQREPFKPERVMAALDDYDREFPRSEERRVGKEGRARWVQSPKIRNAVR